MWYLRKNKQRRQKNAECRRFSMISNKMSDFYILFFAVLYLFYKRTWINPTNAMSQSILTEHFSLNKFVWNKHLVDENMLDFFQRFVASFFYNFLLIFSLIWNIIFKNKLSIFFRVQKFRKWLECTNYIQFAIINHTHNDKFLRHEKKNDLFTPSLLYTESKIY